MDRKTERKYGLYVFLGLLIGAAFGLGLGAANGNILAGFGGGALAGVFTGWFVAAAILENQKRQKDK